MVSWTRLRDGSARRGAGGTVTRSVAEWERLGTESESRTGDGGLKVIRMGGEEAFQKPGLY